MAHARGVWIFRGYLKRKQDVFESAFVAHHHRDGGVVDFADGDHFGQYRSQQLPKKP